MVTRLLWGGGGLFGAGYHGYQVTLEEVVWGRLPGYFRVSGYFRGGYHDYCGYQVTLGLSGYFRGGYTMITVVTRLLVTLGEVTMITVVTRLLWGYQVTLGEGQLLRLPGYFWGYQVTLGEVAWGAGY